METPKKKIKILLIDSDEMMRIYFRDIFWIHGRSDTYEINMASSIKEAEKNIGSEDTRPDTIFLDITTPASNENKNSSDECVKNALSFIEKIKKDNELSSIKIVIFSNKKEDSLKEEVKKLGVDGFLEKGEMMPKEIIDFTDRFHEHNN